MIGNAIFKYKEIIFAGHTFDPGNLIQVDTEKNLNALVGISAEEIKTIIVVGAWRGNEVASFLQYPNAMIYCFEPNESNYNHLVDRWGSNKRVVCFKAACAAFDGESVLHEAHLTGNDSLLPIKEDSKTGLKLIQTHTIKTVRLDSVKELTGKNIDLLWADTQGYELEVLSGAPELLKNTKSLFLEVYKNNMDYQGAVPFDTLTEFLTRHDFVLTAEGLDGNGGNAFYTKTGIHTDAFTDVVYKKRILGSLQGESKKKKLLSFAVIRWLTVHTPIRLKTLIRKILFTLRS